ncbi:MAG: hypothetical protein ACI9F9_000537, partial [Candidatus Paceibacteria bacterium]
MKFDMGREYPPQAESGRLREARFPDVSRSVVEILRGAI